MDPIEKNNMNSESGVPERTGSGADSSSSPDSNAALQEKPRAERKRTSRRKKPAESAVSSEPPAAESKEETAISPPKQEPSVAAQEQKSGAAPHPSRQRSSRRQKPASAKLPEPPAAESKAETAAAPPVPLSPKEPEPSAAIPSPPAAQPKRSSRKRSNRRRKPSPQNGAAVQPAASPIAPAPVKVIQPPEPAVHAPERPSEIRKEAAPESAAVSPEKQRIGRKRSSRRKKTSPQIAAVKEKKILRRIIFASEAGYLLAAIIEKNRITDFWIKPEERIDHGTSGNIYRGIVTRIVPALNAAFVDIGLEKHGFLSFQDMGPELYKKNFHGHQMQKAKIGDVLKPGENILVQLAKEAIADKGPALTAKISIPGRFVVYMPYSDVIRMSRMLDDKEKDWFRELVEREMDLQGGVIFRTASKGRSAGDILNDIKYLTRTWSRIEKEYDSGTGCKLIHREVDLFERVLRDDFTEDVGEIVIDHPRLKYRVSQFLKIIAPRSVPDELIRIHTEKEQSVWKACNLEKDIDRLFTNNIHLDCGGRLIIEEMETLTAIDVNTGKNVAGKTQDETILETNLEAAEEIPRQLRLRQIGGIIIVDFIDMKQKKDKELVFQTLERELEKDRTPSDIQQFTDLGLIQITRQRVGRSLTQQLTYTCPHCGGSGRKPTIKLT
ncbi:MAG: Rne/Rng family ribonuclease [Candidatus Omnitrophota bacterium]